VNGCSPESTTFATHPRYSPLGKASRWKNISIWNSSPEICDTKSRSGSASIDTGATELFGALGFLGAAVATIRLKIVASVRSCKACTGFGIGRCSLCSGKGIVGWEGKWNHQEPCPSCLGRRYVECLSCGGRFHRPLFQHICTTSDTLVRDLENTTTTTTKKRGKMLGS